MIVMKFGGTSVEDAKAINRVASIVSARLSQKPVVVVSAMGGVTDRLVAISHAAASGDLTGALKVLAEVRQRHDVASAELVQEPYLTPLKAQLEALFLQCSKVVEHIANAQAVTPAFTDGLLSFGELLSSAIVTAAMCTRGFKAALVDSRECIVTDSTFTRGIPQVEPTNCQTKSVIDPLLSSGHLPVMGGFISRSLDGEATTLGRGGSDFSAAIVGAALDAKRIEIWTDVQGILTTDPRLCPEAQRVEEISFDEAAELAYFGAKVLHPATMIPAIDKNIPVYVLNSRNPEGSGSCIRSQAPPSKTPFRAIAVKKGITVLNVKAPKMLMSYGFLKELFEIFERHCVPSDLVSTSEVSVSVAFESNYDAEALRKDLERLGVVEEDKNMAIVCLVGKNIRGKVGIAADVFGVVSAAGISMRMISQGASEINISFVVREKDSATAVKHLHRHLFEQNATIGSREEASGELVKR